jgi:3-mercaptopyruvate sulfurtransferase SseA
MTHLRRQSSSTPGALREALLLTLVIVALGVATWLVRPDRLPLQADAEYYALDLPAPLVSVEEAMQAHEQGVTVFVDTRADADLDTAIPGAFIVRAATFATDLDEVRDFIFPEDPLILYGEDAPLPVGDVAALFLARGHTDVRILQGGLAAWQRAGGPSEGEVTP